MWKYCIGIHIKDYDKNLNIMIDDIAYITENDDGSYLADIKHATTFNTKEGAILYAKNVLKLKNGQYMCKRFSDMRFI